MPKPTKSEVRADIVDRAAALFARHGFDHTSLQQIADAVNYSKAGLLHHFPNKFALYSAALEALRAHAQEVRDHATKMPLGFERDLYLVKIAVQFTYDFPGVSALSNRIGQNEPDGDPQLMEVGTMIHEALGIDYTKLDMERLVRVTCAFTGLGLTAMTAVKVDLKREWHDHIVRTTMDALGHHGVDIH